ncbi:MAG: DUF4038 domain-containing protein [Clostridia bacterium]|nr:DUF4038 domain-containing protein [Clostridia bacterium]
MPFTHRPEVPRWGVQEIIIPGPQTGNPFTEQHLTGVFTSAGEERTAPGFYDGEGRYIIRFMPAFEGDYSFRITGSFLETALEGSFTVTPAEEGVHGPVRVSGTYHFAYADGAPYRPVGTTCYVWHLQTPEIFENTLQTLEASPFNKIRFCVFPKHYDYNHNEPFTYPFAPAEKQPGQDYAWDFTRFDPAYFRHLEEAIRRLGEIGIEADIIMLHPYDRWGFSRMSLARMQHYFRYLVSRIAAYRNVWWSLANEYDLMPDMVTADWEALAETIQQTDPYGRLTSIHNCFGFYDHTRPWVTHCCLQRQELHRTTEQVDEWRQLYRKPVIVDELGYEGNIQHGWGNLTGKEETRRFWEATVRGGYAGHGETYLNANGILWWSHGDVLHGTSPDRLQFLSTFLYSLPGPLEPWRSNWDDRCACVPGDDEDAPPVILYYYSFMRPSFRDFTLPGGTVYRAEVLDTWDMTRTDCGLKEGSFRLHLTGRQYAAVCFTRVK